MNQGTIGIRFKNLIIPVCFINTHITDTDDITLKLL